MTITNAVSVRANIAFGDWPEPCWMASNGWDDGYDEADECRLLRERSVAGESNTVPGCPVHGN